MALDTSGLHHVTAIGGDPQRNVEFYLRVLGLRLVKTTVNFDAPSVYHLYYGDESGRPGSLLTFFPWPDVAPGRRGNGQATTVAFSVPQSSLGWWRDHLAADEVVVSATEDTLTFVDPDGLALALVAHPHGDPRDPWDSPLVPAEHAVRGLHSVTLSVDDPDATAELFTDSLGLRLEDEGTDRFRFAAGEGGPGALVDLAVIPGAEVGMVAGGTVHHVAWRAPDDATQAAYHDELADRGVDVTDILDRQYFRSIYFREPAGTLLEVATEAPGFAVDEPLLELGRALKIPPWLEPRRDEIAAALPELRLPEENNPHARDR